MAVSVSHQVSRRGAGHDSDQLLDAATKRAGRFFTFAKFLDVLMKCAKMTFSEQASSADKLAYSAYRQSKLLEAEMLCLLLERMELSQGFNNHEKKTNRPHTSKITLLPRKQVMSSLVAAKDFLM